MTLRPDCFATARRKSFWCAAPISRVCAGCRWFQDRLITRGECVQTSRSQPGIGTDWPKQVAALVQQDCDERFGRLARWSDDKQNARKAACIQTYKKASTAPWRKFSQTECLRTTRQPGSRRLEQKACFSTTNFSKNNRAAANRRVGRLPVRQDVDRNAYETIVYVVARAGNQRCK
jgi:hypothetical protein